MSCGVGEGMVMVCGSWSCAIVLLLLKVTLTFVFLKRLVIFLTCSEECVKVAHFVSCVEAVGCFPNHVEIFMIINHNNDLRFLMCA